VGFVRAFVPIAIGGVFLAYTCAVLLCAAVATTWYCPAKDDLGIEVSLSNGTVRCGTVDTINSERLTLETSSGTIPVDLRQIVGLHAVDSCTPRRGRRCCGARTARPACPEVPNLTNEPAWPTLRAHLNTWPRRPATTPWSTSI